MIRLVCDIRFTSVDDMLEHLKGFVEDAVQVADTDDEVQTIMAMGGEGQFVTEFDYSHVAGYGSVTMRSGSKGGANVH